MRISVVNVVAEEVADSLREFATVFNAGFESPFGEEKFGGEVDEFIVAVVAVDDDEVMNLSFCATHEKAGHYDQWSTGKRVRYISTSLPLSPSSLARLTPSEIRFRVCSALISRLLAATPKQVPKGFDYPRFVKQLTIALEIFGRASFNVQ